MDYINLKQKQVIMSQLQISNKKKYIYWEELET